MVAIPESASLVCVVYRVPEKLATSLERHCFGLPLTDNGNFPIQTQVKSITQVQ